MQHNILLNSNLLNVLQEKNVQNQHHQNKVQTESINPKLLKTLNMNQF